jgi:hypothetical protein
MGILLWRCILRELLNEGTPSLLCALLLRDLSSESETSTQGSLDLESGQAGDVLGKHRLLLWGLRDSLELAYLDYW